MRSHGDIAAAAGTWRRRGPRHHREPGDDLPGLRSGVPRDWHDVDGGMVAQRVTDAELHEFAEVLSAQMLEMARWQSRENGLK